MPFPRGFTLIELVTVIMLLGIIAVGTFGFIGNSVQIYVDAIERDQILSDGRYVVKRFNRELRGAMPGSVRVSEGSSFACIEYVPIETSTQYGDIPVSPEPPADQMEVVPLKEDDGGPFIHSANQYRVYIYPQDNIDVYIETNAVDSGSNKVTFLGDDSDTEASTNDSQKEMVALVDRFGSSHETLFSHDSPAKRVYIVQQPVAFCLDNGEIRRFSGYGYMSSFNRNLLGAGVLMAENLTNDLTSSAETPFRQNSTALQSNAVVQLRLLFERNQEVVEFHNEIHVSNSP